ncbi:hypothetical protein BU25DRAFT_456168 [Macroventuria anomochaeta]|uniref:Uncharacterized protein n=1 Tax=Macroventuria anomochaeta TaxID=301207 RepID=A0ACB6S896_9PLEO|nr:uncharacterized protein BU25DRAFT_456168 [Macroventuria anomochaeta]KAF2630436.1 hypothetical protein BU25DRAFT_456168 [Macroventuria anomochaeta]
MLEPVPFRFLDLPKELRFMVYENLTISTRQLRLLPLETGLQIEHQMTASFDDQPAITVTLQTLPVQIFSICQLIYSEALPFLTRELDKIHKTIPRIIVDADCLYKCALDGTKKLLCALVDKLEQYPFFSPAPGAVYSRSMEKEVRSQYPREVQQWLAQCTHLFLSQRPTPCPFSGFMGTRTYPTVRLIIEVPKLWRYSSYRDLTVASHTHVGTPPMYTASVTSQLNQVYSELVDYTKGLKHVRNGAIVFGQEDDRVLMKDGLVVKKTVALDFGICRVVE